MKTLRNTLLGCLVISGMLHFLTIGSFWVDWNLREQWAGLKFSLSQIMESLDKKETVLEKTEEALATAQKEVTQAVRQVSEGKKLRFGPDNEAWKKLDTQIALEEATRQAEQKKKQQRKGTTQKELSKFRPPPVEIEVIEKKETPPVEPVNSSAVIVNVNSVCGSDPGVIQYEGVGLHYENIKDLKKIPPGELGRVTDQVYAVAKGYPADLAGVKVGDQLVGPPSALKGKKGTQVTAYFYRKGKKISFTMTRAVVCYDSVQKL